MSEFWRKLRFLFGRDRFDHDLDDEMRLHRELREQRLRESGENPEEARRRFGNPTQLQEASREMWSFGALEEFVRNVRHATRALRRTKSLTAIAILSLAVGIGANTAIFSLVRAIVLKQLPVANPSQLVTITQRNEMFHMENCCLPYRFFAELRKQDTGFQDILALMSIGVNLTDREQTERLSAELVSGNYFRMLGVRPLVGRLIDDSDDVTEGAGRVCVISYDLWQDRFGGRPDVIGRQVRINTESFQIVGVTPKGFTGASLHEPSQLQMPSSMIGKFDRSTRETFGWAFLIARLKAGVSREQAAARLNVVGRQVEKVTGPEMGPRDEFYVRDGSQGLSSQKEKLGKPALLLFLLVALVLLVACANLAALLLVRSFERAREAGLRLAIGASRGALVRQFLMESLVLAGLGGAGGWIFGRVLSDVLLSLLGARSQGVAAQARPDAIIFAFCAGLTLLAGVLFGWLPAWRAAHVDPMPAIHGMAVARPGRRAFASNALIAGQIALSMALLFVAGLFTRTLHNLRSIDIGFRPENIALVSIDLSRTAYGEKGGAFFQELLVRARALPETRAASLTSLSVLSGAMMSTSLEIPGYTSPNRLRPTTYHTMVSSGYFRTLGIPLVAGRDFADDERTDGERPVIVNERFAKQFFGGDALNKTFTYGGRRSARVVGVVGASKYLSIREEPPPIAYMGAAPAGFGSSAYLQSRTSGNPTVALEQLRGLVRGLDPTVPIESIATMEMQIDQALARERMLAFLSVLLGGVSAALAAIGLYGVLSFAVVRRTREIGIRMAIGGDRNGILSMFLREGGWVALTGIAAGVPLTLGCGKLASSLIYGLKPLDVVTVAMAVVVLGLVAFAAIIIPAFRATRVDPMIALRYE